jgi:hypothetical protein
MIQRLAVPFALLVAVALTTLPSTARAHCDTLDGPVVAAARAALESGKPAPVLAWVQPGDEAEVKAAFARSLAVRRLGPEARLLADQAFFETLVRVHRAGEGAPYTGLKPAGQDLGPAVAAADRALAQHSAAEVERLLLEAVRHGLQQRLEPVLARPRPGDDVAAGRKWVAAYVAFVHWVERVHQTATAGGGELHAPDREAAGHAHEGH